MSALRSWPSAIGAALAAWPRSVADGAWAVLSAALATLPDRDGAPWRRSRLGRRGFPVEFTFKGRGPGGGPAELRYTTEVDRPESAAAGRLARAVEVADTVVGETARRSGWPADPLAELERLHADGAETLAYGAWLGARHAVSVAAGSTAPPRLKLYAELPDGRSTAAWVGAIERRWRFSTWGGARPILLGIEGGRLELYYQVRAPQAHELPTVLGRAGFGTDSAGALRNTLGRAYGLSLSRGMPAPRVGFSYGLAADPAEGVESFTLYHPADSVFGGDASIRRRWLELYGDGASPGAQQSYRAVSRPLEKSDCRGGSLHHGLFGVVVPRGGRAPIPALGLTPPRAA
ncbi:MAG: hypothetical protein AAGM22_03730 [Acidobacteriota bacterium]